MGEIQGKKPTKDSLSIIEKETARYQSKGFGTAIALA